jgi:hypothetical protein
MAFAAKDAKKFSLETFAPCNVQSIALVAVTGRVANATLV